MDEQRYKLKKDIARRIKILHLTFTGVVVGFLVYIIVFVMLNREVSRGFEEVNKTIVRTEIVKAQRGSIYSRNGEPLATSITRKTLLIDFGSERFDNYERYRKNADTLRKLRQRADEARKMFAENTHAARRVGAIHQQLHYLFSNYIDKE